jgi:hypothetical protein
MNYRLMEPCALVCQDAGSVGGRSMRRRLQFALRAVLMVILGVSSIASSAAKVGSKFQEMAGDQVASSTRMHLDGQSRTLMPDGRLLLIGGVVSSGAVSNVAYLEDPKTGAVRKASGALLHARAYHTATLLPDGKVLIFGGVDIVGVDCNLCRSEASGPQGWIERPPTVPFTARRNGC